MQACCRQSLGCIRGCAQGNWDCLNVSCCSCSSLIACLPLQLPECAAHQKSPADHRLPDPCCRCVAIQRISELWADWCFDRLPWQQTFPLCPLLRSCLSVTAGLTIQPFAVPQAAYAGQTKTSPCFLDSQAFFVLRCAFSCSCWPDQSVPLCFGFQGLSSCCRCVDIQRISELCHARGAVVCIDGTFATPINMRAIDFGADLVLHSATKYLGGHNDLLAGQSITPWVWVFHTLVVG